MPPVARPNAKKAGAVVRQVQPTVPTRFASAPVNAKDHVEQFREARKLREQERFEKLKLCRLKNSSNSSFNVSVAASVSSVASSGNFRTQPPVRSKVAASVSFGVSEVPKSAIARAQPPVRSKVAASVSFGVSEVPKSATARAVNQRNPALPTSRVLASSRTQPSSSSRSNVRENRLPSSSSRRSIGGRKSIVKSKIGCSKLKAPKAEVRLTKTTQLRMLKADPLLALSDFKKSASNQIVLPTLQPLPPKKIPTELQQPSCNNNGLSETLGSKPAEIQMAANTTPKKPLRNIPLEDSRKPVTPSRIPVKKASFVSPLKQTPKPSPLRERLANWLEKRNHSLDNFKHLKCFGVLGPVVKRPQTPFRKVIMSTSSLRAIPEIKETTPNKENSSPNKEDPEDITDEDVSPLNTTFTLEEEDKENICSPKEQENASAIPVAVQQSGKELDQAHGVLSELHKLIQMGYPVEQCGLWLRAVRRRFPQCGDESIYWECLAALEEARGDLQTAVSCYERALLQGAEESSVQNSLDELQKKMSSLHIEPVVSISRPLKVNENKSMDSSNIIRSSSIQFAVKEKCTPLKNMEALDESDSVFTATPVRRSTRLARTPRQETPGVKCVKSLEFLEPEVRRSLVFHSNSALDPED